MAHSTHHSLNVPHTVRDLLVDYMPVLYGILPTIPSTANFIYVCIVWPSSGLQLKTHSKPLLKAFSYALAPGTDTINPVKRKVLVVDDEGVQGDHVAVHRLEPTQKLTEVVARHRQNKLTKAVIVVNTTDGMILEPAFLEGFEGSNYPMLIVSQSDGREILSLVEQEEEDVLCDIEAESAVDAVPHRQPPTKAEGPKETSSQESNKTTGTLLR